MITLAAIAGAGFLIQILIAILVFGVIYYVVTLIPFPEPWKKIALIIIGLIFLIWLINLLLPFIT